MSGWGQQPAVAQSSHHRRQFIEIADRFNSTEEVAQAMRTAQVEGTDLIIACDFTYSNVDNGEISFGGQSLHAKEVQNPYITVLSIICKTLARMDDDQMIPAYGFGDKLSRDTGLFSFAAGDQPLHKLEGVLQAYMSLLPYANLSGPTTWAPAIYKALDIVKRNNGRYHVLVIISDGQVNEGRWEAETKQAIVTASYFPLSIIMVGVGDGPRMPDGTKSWAAMVQWDGGLTDRLFDNFQFVNFTALAERATRMGFTTDKWEADFALHSLMEIPDQYQFLRDNRMLGRCPDMQLPVVPIYNPPAPGN